MSNVFTPVTKENPCPICQRPDYCQFGTYAIKCMRVQSNHEATQGGWYHKFDERLKPTFIPSKKKEPEVEIDAEAVMQSYCFGSNISIAGAAMLDVMIDSLTAIGMGYSTTHNALAFPMKDADGNTIGIRLRNSDGFKWAVKGSRQGIFIPDEELKDSTVYLPEGPTDTCALLSMGLFAIGRPTCNTGNQQIKDCLKRLGIYRAVVVADNDDMKKLGPREGRPGIEGAQKLQRELTGIKSTIWIPPSPCKDARDFLKRGGTRAMIESDLKNRAWSKSV